MTGSKFRPIFPLMQLVQDIKNWLYLLLGKNKNKTKQNMCNYAQANPSQYENERKKKTDSIHV